eukprot:1161691-Pelagomonas_calceolata.AAC.2
MVRNRNHKQPESLWRGSMMCVQPLAGKKKAFLIALKTGQARHACDRLYREYRAEAQRAK